MSWNLQVYVPYKLHIALFGNFLNSIRVSVIVFRLPKFQEGVACKGDYLQFYTTSGTDPKVALPYDDYHESGPMARRDVTIMNFCNTYKHQN